MENTRSQKRKAAEILETSGPLILGALGLLVFHAAWHWQGSEQGYWLPGLGIGVALISWLGWPMVPLLAVDLLLVRWWIRPDSTGAGVVLADTFIHLLHLSASWWVYHRLARGARGLDDPQSATVFLILGPGVLAVLGALLQARCWFALDFAQGDYWALAAKLLLSRTVGILVTAPFLIIVGTPVLLRYGLVTFELPPRYFGAREGAEGRYGDQVELTGLTAATTGLALLLLWSADVTNWILRGSCLILIVWTCIRQGLRGGCLTATIASVVLLLTVQWLIQEPRRTELQSSIQAHLLGFCSAALLLGVSTSWIRANESRYRHVVNRIPFVLYSARLPHGIPSLVSADSDGPRKDSKVDIQTGPAISKLANVVLVSPAAQKVLGVDPESLHGPFTEWLELIEPEDRVIIIAALAQLCLQKQPVTCEYRLRGGQELMQEGQSALSLASVSGSASARLPGSNPVIVFRWLRDTMAPHYSDEGLVDGWESLVEDITDQRALSHKLRKTTNMLQVLVTNLPTGVYFVQAPMGYPILVNARARQLLGQREDLSAGLSKLSKLYRLTKPDGSEYPWEELPVCKALRLGVACRANDIVVRRADGRKISLITWAAPIDLHNTGVPDAAVWVLEDWSAMQQAEQAVRDSETRLRAVIETIDEGVIVQDAMGAIIDCNTSACTILGVAREQLMFRAGLLLQGECVRPDGAAFAREEMPDQQALRTQQPVRSVVIGVPAPVSTGQARRWLLMNSLPLSTQSAGNVFPQKARLVTTVADITSQLQLQESLREARDKYQDLVETLPFMLLQRDRDFNITYANSAATQLTGYSKETMLQPDFCQGIILPEDLPIFFQAAETVGKGQSTRIEVRLHARDGVQKTVLAFIQPNLRDGKVTGSTSLVVDITMQRRLEEELQHAHRLELVGRLASGTVHDFNNLVHVLLGLAGLAKYEVTDKHPAWQYLSRIEEAGEQAAHLAGQILTFSKERPRQRKAVDLNAIVLQTLKLAKGLISNQVTVETLLDPKVPRVLGDENPFKQVLMNLYINARDSMPGGGRLTICTDRAAPPSSPADANGSTWVHLAIQDSGHGMDEAVRKRIFEPFFSTKERGTGLGMSVVQQIISEYGGQIEVTSNPNAGTRIDIWLRQAAEETPDGLGGRAALAGRASEG